jgi:hypothetical protein
MGDKNIRKETKKKKKSDTKSTASPSMKQITPQPEIIKKKDREK